VRIVVAGAGAAGASVAYHLALLGAGDVVLCDRGPVAGESTSRAMGGVRQQFSTEAEVRLAQASIDFFASLGPECFLQVGYLFLATLFCVTWEKIHWSVGADVSISDVLTILFLVAFALEWTGRGERRFPKTTAVVLCIFAALLVGGITPDAFLRPIAAFADEFLKALRPL